MEDEVLIRRGNTLVRRLRLDAGEAMPWHRDPCERSGTGTARPPTVPANSPLRATRSRARDGGRWALGPRHDGSLRKEGKATTPYERRCPQRSRRSSSFPTAGDSPLVAGGFSKVR